LDCAKTVVLDLRQTEGRVRTGYVHAAAVLAGALLLEKLGESLVIDRVESSSVKTAIELGLSQPEKHGCQRILNLIADMAVRKRSKGAPQQIAALFFDIDYRRAAILDRIAKTFIKAPKLFAADSEDFPCVICVVVEGTVTPTCDDGRPAEINLRGLVEN
jgi:hypothetical protein